MNTEEFLNISMSLASEVDDFEKVAILLSVHTKSNLKDWSAAFVSYTLREMGYIYSKVDVPANYLTIGVHTDKPELGDVIIFKDSKENIKVGFFFKEVESNDTEIDNIIILITTDDDKGILKVSIPKSDMLDIRIMSKIPSEVKQNKSTINKLNKVHADKIDKVK